MIFLSSSPSLELTHTSSLTVPRPRKRFARLSFSFASNGPSAFPSSSARARTDSRPHSFTEMCQTRPTLVALDYLQTTLASVVDHTDAAEASSFRLCMTALLSAPASNNCEVATAEDVSILTDGESTSSLEGDSAEVDEKLYAQRQHLFEQLMDFVPDEDRQPREDLKDICTRRDLL